MKSVYYYLTERASIAKKQEYNNDPKAIEQMIRDARKGDIESVQVYIDKHVDIDAKNSWNNRAIDSATESKQTEMVNFLLDNGADTKYITSKSLKLTNKKIFDLLKNKVSNEVIYETFFTWQKDGDEEHIEIIQDNLRLLTKEQIGDLFYVACVMTMVFDESICDFYLENGVDINHKYDYGSFNALYSNIKKSQYSAIEYLLKRGADYASKVAFGKSPKDLIDSSKDAKLKQLFKDLNERASVSKKADYEEGSFGYWWTKVNGEKDIQGQHYKGGIDCSDNNLTSLEGAPSSVEGYFDCSDNLLVSLQGVPRTIKRNFSCYDNNLTSLEGAPSNVGGYFDCMRQKNNHVFTVEDVQSVSEVKGEIYV